MDIERARAFIAEHHRGVMATFRSDGGLQMAPIAVTADADGLAIVSSRETAMKVANLRRDPRVSVCCFTEDWYGEWIRIDGRAEVVSLPDALEGLVDYYRRAAGEHPDWDEYRQAMRDQRRVLIRITIEDVGPTRSG